jgi:hypothetical protein
LFFYDVSGGVDPLGPLPIMDGGTPVDWVLLGSLNGTEWILIDLQIEYGPTWKQDGYTDAIPVQSQSVRYIAYVVTKNHNSRVQGPYPPEILNPPQPSGKFFLSEMDFFNDPSPPLVTPHNLKSSTRDPIFQVTASNVSSVAKEWNLFDGVLSSPVEFGLDAPGVSYDLTTGEYNISGTSSLGIYNGEWVKIQVALTNQTPVAFDSFRLATYASSTDGCIPRDFSIISSLDGSSWQLWGNFIDYSPNKWKSGDYTQFLKGPIRTARYIAFVVTKNSNGLPGVTTKYPTFCLSEMDFVYDLFTELTIPYLTSPTSDPVVRVTASNVSSVAQAWNLFDESYTNQVDFGSGSYDLLTGNYTGNSSLGGYDGEWVKIQVAFPSQYPKKFNTYVVNSITDDGNKPRDWLLLGSLDDTKWNVIDQQLDTSALNTEILVGLQNVRYLGFVVTRNSNELSSVTAFDFFSLIALSFIIRT